MRIGARPWLPVLLCLCAIATGGLLVWPGASAAPRPRPAADHYRGPDIETRRAGPVSSFALRLASPGAPAAAPEAVEAVPVLVGVAGQRAYLRSAASGEVEGVRLGASIDGWRLVSVSGRTATLRGASGDKRVEMFAVTAAAPSPDAVPPFPVPALMPTPPSTSGTAPAGG